MQLNEVTRAYFGEWPIEKGRSPPPCSVAKGSQDAMRRVAAASPGMIRCCGPRRGNPAGRRPRSYALRNGRANVNCRIFRMTQSIWLAREEAVADDQVW